VPAVVGGRLNQERDHNRSLDPHAAPDRSHSVWTIGANPHPPSHVMAADIVWQRSHSASVGLIGDAHLADAGRVSEQVVCLECGSASLVSSGVFEHGTWTHRLTCWTCRDCRTVFTVPAAEALGLDAEDVIARPVGPSGDDA